MLESLLYLATSFWLGAVHAATPGHGKTIAASYIVGARGRPVDAVVLGIFVTLSHTSGIVLVALLATAGSAWLIPQRVEAYLALGTGLLVVAIGVFMLRDQRRLLFAPDAHAHVDGADASHDHRHHDHAHADLPEHDHAHADPGHVHSHGGVPHHHHDGDQPHTHESGHAPAGHVHHRHGWGFAHTHDVEALAQSRPSLGMLLALGVAGGLLPDPGALAILLSAIASGRLMLGLLTVVVFSLGFAAVLVLVGVVAARVGTLVLDWLSSRWVVWIQIGAAVVIVAVGIVLTANAWRTVSALG